MQGKKGVISYLFVLFLYLLNTCQCQVWQTIAKYFYDVTDTVTYNSNRADWEKTGDYGSLSSGFPQIGGYYLLGKIEVSNTAILKVKNIIPHTQLRVSFKYVASGTPFNIMCFVTTDTTVDSWSVVSVASGEQTFTTVIKSPHTADHVDILITGSGYASDSATVANQCKYHTSRKINFYQTSKYKVFSFRNFVLEANVCHSSCASCNLGMSDIKNCATCYNASFTLTSGMCLCGSSSFMIIQNPCPSIPCASCTACHSNCLTCFQSGSQGCLSCQSDSYFYNNQCFIQCQAGTYQDEVNKTCGDCYPSCQECSGPGNQQCISCKQPGPGIKYLDVNQCVDSCPIGKFANPSTKMCEKCDPTCYQCDDSKDYTCTDCSDPYFFYLDIGTGKKSCLKTCPSKYYANVANRKCDSCSTQCGDCTTTPTTCTSCGTGVVSNQYFLNGTTCVQAANCPIRTFADTVSYTCKACHSDCLLCSGDQQDNCTKCDIGQSRYLQDAKFCVQTCKDGTFKDTTSGNPLCSLCHTDCFTCSSYGTTTCLKCPPSKYLQYIPVGGPTGQCQSTCNNHYYPDNSDFICKICHSTCDDCTGPNLNQCSSCTGATFLTTTYECVGVCPDGYYGLNNVCQPCNLTLCKTCVDNNSKCTSCNGALFLDDNVCVISCPSDKYTSPTDKKCYKCFANCLTCEGSSNNQCVTCQPTTKYFSKNPTDNKGQCTNDCNTLSRIRFDGPIYQNSIPQEFSCLSSCPQYYYINLSGPYCERCHPTCLECANPTSSGCTKCYDPFYLYNGTCGFCPSGKFGTLDASGNRVCSDCNSSCKTCKGKNINDCTSCQLNQYLNEDGTCGLCSAGTYGYIDTCVKTCPFGMYGENFPQKICKTCDSSCATCFERGDINCYSCKTNFYLYGTTCKATCVDGTWPKPVSANNLEPVCSPCDSSCNTCTGPSVTNCTACRDGRYLYNNQECVLMCPGNQYGQSKNKLNQCVTSCDSDQYQDVVDKTCKICSIECKGCTGPTYKFCLECATGYIRFQDMCVKTCPNGFWMNDQKKTCDPCTDQCTKCEQNQQHKCLECSKKYFLHEGVCINKCPDLLQPNIEKQLCEACPDKTFTLYDSKQKQIQCLDCHFSCAKCSGPLQNQCTLCEPTRGQEGLIPLKGYCFCKTDLIEKLEKTCYQKDTLDEFATGSQTLSFFTTTIISSFIGLFGNPTLLFSFVEISQQLSYITYLNTTFPQDYDNFSQRFYGFNINNIIVNPLTKIDLGGTQSEVKSSGRALQSAIINIDQQNQSNNAYLKDQKANDKFYFNDKTSSFLYNAFTILMISVFFWTIALIYRFGRYVYRKVYYKSVDDQLALKKKQFTIGNKISAALTVGLPFIIFQITSLEFILYSLLQYKDMNDKTLFNFISFCVCVAGSVYFFLMIYYIYYVLNIMKKHRKQNYYSKWSFLWSQVNYQKSKMRRNFFLLLIVKKFFICIFLVFVQVRLEFQMLGIFLFSALTLGYMLFVNPYQERFYRYVSIIAYTLVTIIHGCLLVYSLTSDTNNQVQSISAAKVISGILMLFYCVVCIIELVRNIPIIFKILKNIFAHKKEIQQQEQQRVKKVQLQDDEKGFKNELIENSVVNPLENIGSDEEIEEELGPKHLKYSSDEDEDSDDSDDTKNQNGENENDDDEDDNTKKKFNSSEIPLTQFMLNNKRSLSRNGSIQSDMSMGGIKQSASVGNMGIKNTNNNYSIKFRLPRAESQLEYQISNQKFSEIQKNQNFNQSFKDNSNAQLQPEIQPQQSKKKIKLKGLKQNGNLMNSLKILQQNEGLVRNNQSQLLQSKQSLPQSSLKKPPKVNEKKAKMQGLLRGLNFDSDKKKSNEFEETPFY